MRNAPWKISVRLRGSITFFLALSILTAWVAMLHPVRKAAAEGETALYLPMLTRAQPGNFYYVSLSGRDANPGTYDHPWHTLSKAASRLKAGDTLLVRGGVYTETVDFSKSGTQDLPIHIMAYPGEAAVIDGANRMPSLHGGTMVEISGSWVRVSGLEIRNSLNYGLVLTGKYDTVENLFVHHIRRAGIVSMGDYDTVQNCLIWRASLVNQFNASPNSYASGISTGRDVEDGMTQGAIIRNNRVSETWGQGITVNHSESTLLEGNSVSDSYSANIYLHDTLNAVVNGNLVFMTGSYMKGYGSNVGIMLGGETYDPPSEHITITNNIAYNNKRNFFWFQGRQACGMKNVLIAHNTFVNSTHEYGNVEINQGTHENVRFINNIIVQDDEKPLALIAENDALFFSNNLWSRPPEANVSGTGDVIGDPLLAKTGSEFAPEWYRLTELSPAINIGLPLTEVTVDFRGTARDDSPDMGAYEYP